MNKYELVKPENKEKIFTVSIVADSNDGDYITTTEAYNESEFKEIVEELIVLKKCYGNSHELEDFYNTEYNIDMPFGEGGQCHSLSYIEIHCIDENGQYYDVELNMDFVNCEDKYKENENEMEE